MQSHKTPGRKRFGVLSYAFGGRCNSIPVRKGCNQHCGGVPVNTGPRIICRYPADVPGRLLPTASNDRPPRLSPTGMDSKTHHIADQQSRNGGVFLLRRPNALADVAGQRANSTDGECDSHPVDNYSTATTLTDEESARISLQNLQLGRFRVQGPKLTVTLTWVTRPKVAAQRIWPIFGVHSAACSTASVISRYTNLHHACTPTAGPSRKCTHAAYNTTDSPHWRTLFPVRTS